MSGDLSGQPPQAPQQQGGSLEQSPHILTPSPGQATALHSAPGPGCPNITLLTISALSDSPTRTSSNRTDITVSGRPRSLQTLGSSPNSSTSICPEDGCRNKQSHEVLAESSQQGIRAFPGNSQLCEGCTTGSGARWQTPLGPCPKSQAWRTECRTAPAQCWKPGAASATAPWPGPAPQSRARAGGPQGPAWEAGQG